MLNMASWLINETRHRLVELNGNRTFIIHIYGWQTTYFVGSGFSMSHAAMMSLKSLRYVWKALADGSGGKKVISTHMFTSRTTNKEAKVTNYYYSRFYTQPLMNLSLRRVFFLIIIQHSKFVILIQLFDD